jgi:hypothetical protein
VEYTQLILDLMVYIIYLPNNRLLEPTMQIRLVRCRIGLNGMVICLCWTIRIWLSKGLIIIETMLRGCIGAILALRRERENRPSP